MKNIYHSPITKKTLTFKNNYMQTEQEWREGNFDKAVGPDDALSYKMAELTDRQERRDRRAKLYDNLFYFIVGAVWGAIIGHYIIPK